jgi:hypothetical protein
MTKAIAILGLLWLSGCVTSPKIQSMYDERNYSEQDKADIQVYTSEYIRLLSHGTAASNAFNSSPHTQSVQVVSRYFCVCTSRLGDKCQQNSENVSDEERELWAKGAGAEFALHSTGNGAHADPILCQGS